jgi:hypothetical protein
MGAFHNVAEARPVGPVYPARLFSQTSLNDTDFTGAVHRQSLSRTWLRYCFKTDGSQASQL